MASADFTPSAAFPTPSTSDAPSSDASPADAARVLQSNLQRLAARRNAMRLWREIARSLSVGAGLAVLMVLAYRFYLVDGPVWLPAIPVLFSLLIGWRLGTLARGSTFAAALEADEQLDLKERLSSALAFVQPEAIARSHTAPAASGVLPRLRAALLPRFVTQEAVPAAPTVLVPSLVQDAAVRSENVEPKVLYPLRFDRTHRVLALTLALFLVAALMPNVPWFLSAAEQTQRKNIAQQGKGLVAIAKEIKKDEPKQAKEESQSKRLARKMEALGHKMMRGRMSKKEALTSLGELKKDLEKASRNDASNQSSGNMQNMQQALDQIADQPMESETGQKLQDAARKGDAEAAAKELEKLADKMEKGEMSAAEKQKAADDLQKMADQLKKQGGQQNEQMAQQLEQAAQALKQQAGQQSQQQSQQGQQQNGKKQQGQKQGQQGQSQNSQSQQGQNKQGQNKQSQSQQSQSQQSQGGSAQQGRQQGNNQGMGNSLRQMAKSLRQGGGGSNSQGLQRMLNKIRQAERDTGMNNGGQSGAPKMSDLGQGNCPGGDCNGKTMTPGKDLKSSDPHGPVSGGPGLGPRSHAMGSKAGGGVSDTKSKRTGDKRRWEDVWSDRLPATHKKIDRIQGKYQDDGEMEQLPTKTEAKGGPVKTPYYEVYESYKKDAEDAVGKDTVPPAYKQPVKDYFESIKPNQ